jgi:hypothetical protein
MINVTRYLCPSVLVALLRVVSTCGYGAPYTYGDLTRCVLNMSQFDKCGDDFTALKEGGSIELVIHRSSMGATILIRSTVLTARDKTTRVAASRTHLPRADAASPA